MAKGDSIVVSADPKGTFIEGYVSGTPKPGTVMQLKAGTADAHGNFTWEVFNGAADGERTLIAVLLHDWPNGKTVDDAYANGDVAQLYIPAPGDELNVLLEDQAGTADSYNVGDKLIVKKGTGKLIKTTGTPESEPFVVLENLGAITADTLCHAVFTGY